MPRAPAYLGQHLIVRGQRMARSNKAIANRKEPTINTSIEQITAPKLQFSNSHVSPVISDFMEYLKSKSDLSTMIHESNTSDGSEAGYIFEQPVEQEREKKKKRKGVFANSDFSDNLSEDDNICINDNNYNSDNNNHNNKYNCNNVFINTNRAFNNRQKFLMCRKNQNEHNQKSNERSVEKSRKRLETRETDLSNDHIRLRHRHCFSRGKFY